MKNQIEKLVHSKLPWNCHDLSMGEGTSGQTIYEANGIAIVNTGISSPYQREMALGDGEFIVTACNEYDALCAIANAADKFRDEMLGHTPDHAIAARDTLRNALQDLAMLRANTQPVLTTEK